MRVGWQLAGSQWGHLGLNWTRSFSGMIGSGVRRLQAIANPLWCLIQVKTENTTWIDAWGLGRTCSLIIDTLYWPLTRSAIRTVEFTENSMRLLDTSNSLFFVSRVLRWEYRSSTPQVLLIL